MPAILPTPTITTSSLLDRDAPSRADAEALEALSRTTDARFLVIVNGRVLIRSNAERTLAAILWLDAASVASLAWTQSGAIRLYLGRDRLDGSTRFSLCITAPLPEHGGDPWPTLPGPLVDLRSLAMQGVMGADELSLVAEALMLASWHDGALYCGRCGAPTEPREGGWKRACTSTACAREIFPRIDPVVIMLVTDGDRCVLTREARFPPGMVSTLAGFIEPGEDILHAVRRETVEEIGITVANVRFIASQPWPFPHSLMIGCIANAATFDLKPDPSEIETAHWYETAEVRCILARRPCEHEPWLPGKQSLANLLVRNWLDEHPA